jgi:hypothetical protein
MPHGSQLSDAIVIWTGWRKTQSPARDEQRVVARFGADAAVELMPKIRELEDDFYRSDARFTVEDLKEMGDEAARSFRDRHPEISEDAVQAFAWCYSYDYR